MREEKFHGNMHKFSKGRPSSFVFQTVAMDGIRPRERYDFWGEAIVRGIDLERPDDDKRARFDGAITSLATPSTELHYGRFEAFRGRRLGHRIRSGGVEEVSLFYVHAGKIVSEQDGDIEFSAEAGDFFFYDSSCPTSISFDASHVVEFNLPRSAVAAIYGAMPRASFVGEALRASGLATMLRAQMALLPRILDGLTDTEKLVALDAMEALAMTVLEGAVANFSGGQGADSRALDHETHYQGLFVAAQRYIRGNLSHPNLDTVKVARALGCSRSTLYRAFSHHGLAVADYIREMRLARFRALLERAPASVHISSLAARCGLYDVPNLSRMFRSKFGLTPSEIRAVSRQAADCAVPSA